MPKRAVEKGLGAENVVRSEACILTALIALCVALALGSGVSTPQTVGAWFLLLLTATLAGLVCLRHQAGRVPSPASWYGLSTTLAAFLAIVNSVYWLYHSEGVHEAMNLTLLGVGTLSFFLSSERFSLVVLVSLSVWALLEWQGGVTSGWLHFAFGLFLAAGVKVPIEFRNGRFRETLGRLQLSEERYALAARGSKDGLWDWDLAGQTASFSERCSWMLDLRPGELGGSPFAWLDRVHPEDRPSLDLAIADHLSGAKEHLEHEYRILKGDGTYTWVLTRGLALRDRSGCAYRMAGSHTDIADRKEHEQQLLRETYHDRLTGLPNRDLFVDNLERALARRRRQPGYLFAVLLVDLDRFKVINDSLGHLAGDQIIKQMSLRLLRSSRRNDMVARFGGDEFAIFLDGIPDSSFSLRFSRRIQNLLGKPVDIDGRKVFTSASVGIVLYDDRHENADALLRDADTALYRAKQNSSLRAEVFDREMHVQAMERLVLETGLRTALQNREFVLHYQPIVSSMSREIVAVEALLRWNHPERGLVFPGDFLGVADESGVLPQIDAWVLEQACREASRWAGLLRLPRGLPVNVNISARQFLQPGFSEWIARLLAESGMPPSNLRLELTENSVMETGSAAVKKLQSLRSLGVEVYLDDFGTGYSSLGYLHKLPIDGLKIDRSFIQQMATQGEMGELTKAILKIARAFRLEVTAEGVETARQLAFLAQSGCPYIQGFYFSKALPSSEFESLFQNWRQKMETGARLLPFPTEPAGLPEGDGDDRLSVLAQLVGKGFQPPVKCWEL